MAFLGVMVVLTIVGIFLFPRTVGMAFTPMSLSTPLAFLISLIRHGWSFSLLVLVMGVVGWLVTFIVGTIRPDAT